MKKEPELSSTTLALTLQAEMKCYSGWSRGWAGLGDNRIVGQNVTISVKFNGKKLVEHDSIVKTPSELNPFVQRRYVDLTSRCPVKRSNIRCNQTSRLSGSGPEGSKGMHPVLMYVLMPGLGPMWLRPSPVHKPLSTSSDYCCHPRIDRLL